MNITPETTCAGFVISIAYISIDAPLFSGIKFHENCATCQRRKTLDMSLDDIFEPDDEQGSKRCKHYIQSKLSHFSGK